MKKIIIGGIAVLAIAAVVTFNVSFNTQNDKLSNLSLANVEALAQSESGLGSGFGTSHFGCVIAERFICGYDMEGNPIFCEKGVPGQMGVCSAPSGSCAPYSCTRVN